MNNAVHYEDALMVKAAWYYLRNEPRIIYF